MQLLVKISANPLHRRIVAGAKAKRHAAAAGARQSFLRFHLDAMVDIGTSKSIGRGGREVNGSAIEAYVARRLGGARGVIDVWGSAPGRPLAGGRNTGHLS